MWSAAAVKEYVDRRIEDHRRYVDELAGQRDARLGEQGSQISQMGGRIEGLVTARTYDAGQQQTTAEVRELASKVEAVERTMLQQTGRREGVFGLGRLAGSWVNFGFGAVGLAGGIIGLLGITGNL